MVILFALLDARARCTKVKTHQHAGHTYVVRMCGNTTSLPTARGLTSVTCMRQAPAAQAYVISGVEDRWLSTNEVLAGLGIKAQRVVPVKPSQKLAEREFSVRARFISVLTVGSTLKEYPALPGTPETSQGLVGL